MIVEAVKESLKDTTDANITGYKSGLEDGQQQAQSGFQQALEAFAKELNEKGEATIVDTLVVPKSMCE